jgi:tetratricopeptide (TPR) repeat protein
MTSVQTRIQAPSLPVSLATNMPSSMTAKPIGVIERFVIQWQAKLLLMVGQSTRAKQVHLDLLARAPDDVLTLNSLGYAELQSGHPAQAQPYFEKVAALAPAASNSHFNLAFVNEELGRLDEAEAGFKAAIAIEEKMDRAWYGLGLVLVRQGRLEEALKALQRNTTLQPMSPFGWYQMARVHVELKQPDEARAVIRHLTGFEPKIAAQLERETGLKAD